MKIKLVLLFTALLLYGVNCFHRLAGNVQLPANQKLFELLANESTVDATAYVEAILKFSESFIETIGEDYDLNYSNTVQIPPRNAPWFLNDTLVYLDSSTKTSLINATYESDNTSLNVIAYLQIPDVQYKILLNAYIDGMNVSDPDNGSAKIIAPIVLMENGFYIDENDNFQVGFQMTHTAAYGDGTVEVTLEEEVAEDIQTFVDETIKNDLHTAYTHNVFDAYSTIMIDALFSVNITDYIIN